MRNYISEKYGIAKESISVGVTLDESDTSCVEIKKLTLTLPKSAPAEKIKAELDEMFLHKTEIEIIYGR